MGLFTVMLFFKPILVSMVLLQRVLCTSLYIGDDTINDEIDSMSIDDVSRNAQGILAKSNDSAIYSNGNNGNLILGEVHLHDKLLFSRVRILFIMC